MFTLNYIEALRWCANNLRYDGANYTNDQLKQFIMINTSNTSKTINPTTAQLVDASIRLNQFFSNLFYNAALYIGYAANTSEMSDYSSHATGIPTDNQGYSVNVTGEEGHKYIEHITYHTYTNNTNSAITMNKLVVANRLEQYWNDVGGTTTNTRTVQTIPLIIEEITDPIIMQPGETRRFNYKIKFPMFF